LEALTRLTISGTNACSQQRDCCYPLRCHTQLEGISMRTTLLLTALLAAVAMSPPAGAQHLVTQGDRLDWKPGPPFMPPGLQMVVLVGDPSKDAPYILRFKFPAGYKVPAHTHPGDENATVISGAFYIGMGPKLDERKGEMLKAGGLLHMPKGMQHYAWTTEETILQVHGIGPASITYVDPADDPRNKK
jgi:quercetin dioxygenase-like cupin family protein